jgi:predicted RNase H-like nuclease
MYNITALRPFSEPAQGLAGVDGCRGGWIVATERGVLVTPRLSTDIGTTIGVDMPIGLPSTRPRASDREARAYLGPRRSTIFPTPPRACLEALDYPTALAASRAAIGTGISIQAFHLLAKIRELDSLVTVDANPFVEVHPECSFLTMNQREPLPPKTTQAGAARRAELLRVVFGELPSTPRGAKLDDLHDAYAVLWSTARFVRGAHLTFGDDEVDARGLPMRVVC